MNPKGHNRLLRTNEAWFQEQSFSYDTEPWDACILWTTSMGYMNPMDVIHGHVSHGDLHGIHVSHGYPWEIIPCNTMCTWPSRGQVGVRFWKSQGLSRGRCWVSIKGPMGFSGSIQVLFGPSFGRSGNHPGTIQGVSRDL